MKRIDPGLAGQNHIISDEERGNCQVKYKYLREVILKKFKEDLKENATLREFLDFLDQREQYAYHPHYYRYFNTMRRIVQSRIGASAMHGQFIVEAGGVSPILTFLALTNECYSTEADLRTSIDVPSGVADMVFSLEVLEHLKDQPEKNFDQIVLFQGTGVRQYAQEILTNPLISPDSP